VPTLILHGDDDQIVPIDVGGRQSVKLIKNATLVVYEGAPHGFALTHKDRVNQDLLAFIREGSPAPERELAEAGARSR
jgi:non-heme chloroperoxidase